VRTDQGEVELPPTARAAVRRLLADLAAGTAVHLLTDDTELTTRMPLTFSESLGPTSFAWWTTESFRLT